MPELLEPADQTRMANLLDRTGLLRTANERNALLIEIGVSEADIDLDGPAHVAGVILVNRLVNVGNRDALRIMLLRISSRMHAAADADLSRLQKLLQLTNEDLTSAGSFAPVPVPGNSVVQALNVLPTLTNAEPRIREAALRFSAEFETARVQIQEVTGYKALHDQLHDLAQKVEVPMEKLAPDFPAKEEAAEELQDYRIIFEEVNRQLRGIAQRFPDADTSWIDTLDTALNDLRTALQNNDPALLSSVIRRVKRQLTLRLPQINNRLNAAAAALRLRGLVWALQIICERAAGLEGESQRFRQFKDGVETLDRMEKNLTALLKHHDLWQEFDAQLRAMESNLEDIRSWWPDVNDLVVRLSQSYGDVPWMASFVAECGGLQKAIDSGEPRRVSQAFRLLRRQVAIRFYNTDADLMSQCDELSSVGEPLMRVIE
jgi:hypothetical protein